MCLKQFYATLDLGDNLSNFKMLYAKDFIQLPNYLL